MKQKIIHFHYDLYKYPKNQFTIYRMEPSPNYKKYMYKWKLNKKQIKLITKDKCENLFRLISFN